MYVPLPKDADGMPEKAGTSGSSGALGSADASDDTTASPLGDALAPLASLRSLFCTEDGDFHDLCRRDPDEKSTLVSSRFRARVCT